MKSADRIVLAWCDPGQVDGAFAVSVARVNAARRDRITALLRTQGGVITRQRNETIALFLRTDAAWLMMVDSDQELTLPAFDLLVNSVHDKDRPAVSGLVFAAYKGDLYPKPIPTIYRDASDGFYEPMNDYPENTLIEVASAGGGFFLIHRTVLEAIRADAAPDQTDWCWFRDGPTQGRWLSEDHFFWRQVRRHGYPIHAHTGAILPHHKRYWLDNRHHKEAQNG